mmetsp:Transcript_39236/g.104148  ORF Transcript_39236/g.104148 Transcript_39236/m.104148 type:complete len:130 (+) Transcript_39236:648-1037(+)
MIQMEHRSNPRVCCPPFSALLLSGDLSRAHGRYSLSRVATDVRDVGSKFVFFLPQWVGTALYPRVLARARARAQLVVEEWSRILSVGFGLAPFGRACPIQKAATADVLASAFSRFRLAVEERTFPDSRQ